MANTYNLRQINPTNTAAQWLAVNPVLLEGELGFESDTLRFKIGDGVTSWDYLPYSESSAYQLLPGAGISIANHTIGALLLYEVLNE